MNCNDKNLHTAVTIMIGIDKVRELIIKILHKQNSNTYDDPRCDRIGLMSYRINNLD